jgi:hypothetical protein
VASTRTFEETPVRSERRLLPAVPFVEKAQELSEKEVGCNERDLNGLGPFQ